jgi:hypothetical protein
MNRKYMAASMVRLLMLPSLIFAECLNYEPDSVLLTGKIVRKTFPGRPNYENIKTVDEPETYWILIPAKPFCVNGKTEDSEYPDAMDIRQVQLVFLGNEYHTYKNLVGKRIIVQGQLFPMQTGHHHTSVLITVRDMRRDNK